MWQFTKYLIVLHGRTRIILKISCRIFPEQYFRYTVVIKSTESDSSPTKEFKSWALPLTSYVTNKVHKVT